MAWKEQLGRVTIDGKPTIGASFRGVPFLVQNSDRSGGRRGPVHEYPDRDEPFVEDLGRKAQVFRVDGYVIGPNYLFGKNNLIDALEDTEGPGDLRHPYHGKRRCVCRNFNVTESIDEGGMARFSIEFTATASAIPFPASALDPQANLLKSATSALNTARGVVDDAGNFSGLSSDFLGPAEDLIRTASGAMDEPFSALLTTAEDLASMRARLNRLVEDAASLARNPLDAFDAILDALDFAFAPPTIPGWIKGLLSVYDFDVGKQPTPPILTPSRESETEAYNLIRDMTKQIVTIKTAEIASSADFALFSEAIEARDGIVENLDDQLTQEDIDDDLFQSLSDLKADTVQSVPVPEKQLQTLVELTPPVTTQSLVLAYNLYGDIEREQELVDLNAIKYPGFVIGGQTLEYVTDAVTETTG